MSPSCHSQNEAKTDTLTVLRTAMLRDKRTAIGDGGTGAGVAGTAMAGAVAKRGAGAAPFSVANFSIAVFSSGEIGLFSASPMCAMVS